MQPERTYYENGQIESERWFVNGQRHRLDGPAVVNYYESGQIWSEHWRVNNENLTEQEFNNHPLVIGHKFDKALDEVLYAT